jgi:DNA modification methylase
MLLDAAGGVSIYTGDARDVIPNLPSDYYDCIVTSPPYYWARDYGVDGQIGHEQTPEMFIWELADVFDECRRVMKDTGTLWVNIGDSYYSGNGQPKGHDPRSSSRNFMRGKLRPLDMPGWDIPKKSLLGIPWMLAHELQRREWTVRADIIWCRKTALAEASVKDRPYRQHEYVFLLSKSRWYHFDRAALPEQSVWHIPHDRRTRGHNAAFPPELVERCIKAGCPEGGTVLDPFGGSGTTGFVANRLGRKATLIELNSEYAKLAARRISEDASLFAARAALKGEKNG